VVRFSACIFTALVAITAMVLTLVAPLTDVPHALAGEGIYKVDGVVTRCDSEHPEGAFGNQLAADCIAPLEGLKITTTSDDSVDPGLFFTDANGAFSAEAGSAQSTSLVVQFQLPADSPTGVISCSLLAAQNLTLVANVVLPLDANGSAELVANQPTWQSAFCNVLVWAAAGDGTSDTATAAVEGNLAECDTDIRADPSESDIDDHCTIQMSSRTVAVIDPAGGQQVTANDAFGRFSFAQLPTGVELTFVIKNRPTGYGTVAFCHESEPVDGGAQPDLQTIVGSAFPNPDEPDVIGTVVDNEGNPVPRSSSISADDPADRGANLPGYPVSLNDPDVVYHCSFVLMPFAADTTTAGTPSDSGGSSTALGVADFDAAVYTCDVLPTSSVVEDYWNACEEYEGSTPFHLTGATSGQTFTQSTGDVSPGMVIFDNLPPDDYRLTQTPTGGYGSPTVFCSLYDGASQSPYEQVPVDDSLSVEHRLTGVDAYSCEWFLVAGGGQPDTDSPLTLPGLGSPIDEELPEASPADSDSSGISGPAEFDASFYTCAETPGTATVDDFWATCDPYLNPLNIELRRQSNGMGTNQDTGDLAPGAVIFDGIAADDWNAVTVPPDGFLASTVFCARFDGTEQGPYGEVEVEQPAGMNFTLQGQDALTCEWFFVTSSDQPNDGASDSSPGADPPTSGNTSAGAPVGTAGNQTVTIVLRNCPVLYRGTDYQSDCTEVRPNVRFSLRGLGVTPVEFDETTDASGSVSFTVPYTGNDVVLLEEGVPGNVNVEYVLGCERDGQTFETPFFPAYIVSIGGTIRVVVPSGSEITCTWINIPFEAAAIPQSTGLAFAGTAKASTKADRGLRH